MFIIILFYTSYNRYYLLHVPRLSCHKSYLDLEEEKRFKTLSYTRMYGKKHQPKTQINKCKLSKNNNLFRREEQSLKKKQKT